MLACARTHVSFILALFVLSCSCGVARAQEPSPQPAAEKGEPKKDEIVIGEKRKLHSKVLNEERPYWVWLPPSYEPNKYLPTRYPVLYLLDGDSHFHSASGAVHFMSAVTVQVPEMIVVGIPNTDRTRDLTPTHSLTSEGGTEDPSFKSSGGGDAFLKFLREELFPQIEADYRTLPYRVIVGHSLGGLIALHALLDAPEMFQACVAIDPSVWWDDKILLKRARERFTAPQERRGAVYISQANIPAIGDEDPFVHTGSIRRFAGAIKRGDSATFRSKIEFYEDEDHASVSLLSLYHGLRFIFDGYKLQLEDFLNRPADYEKRLEQVSERLGVALAPREELYDYVGLELLTLPEDMVKDGPQKSVMWLQRNTVLYPESANGHDSLAKAYEARGEKALAIESLEKSLKLKPDNEEAKKRLEELKKPNEGK